jgi:hypothetical protein
MRQRGGVSASEPTAREPGDGGFGLKINLFLHHMRFIIKSISKTADASLAQTLQTGFLQSFPQPTTMPQAVAFFNWLFTAPQPFTGTSGLAMTREMGFSFMAIMADAAARPALTPSTHSSEGRLVATGSEMLGGISKY